MAREACRGSTLVKYKLAQQSSPELYMTNLIKKYTSAERGEEFNKCGSRLLANLDKVENNVTLLQRYARYMKRKHDRQSSHRFVEDYYKDKNTLFTEIWVIYVVTMCGYLAGKLVCN